MVKVSVSTIESLAVFNTKAEKGYLSEDARKISSRSSESLVIASSSGNEGM